MRLTRRQFIATGLVAGAATVAGLGGSAVWQAGQLRTRYLDRRDLGAGLTLAFASDLHYRGDPAMAAAMVARIREASPEVVLFGGDLVEHQATTWLDEALAWLQACGVPVIMVPGNHDPLDAASRAAMTAACAATGGRFCWRERIDLGPLVVHGVGEVWELEVAETKPTVLLCHAPAIGRRVPRIAPYDLVLCGHSHGGQIVLPLVGTPWVPPGCGGYIRGSYMTPMGPLEVTTGVGTWQFPVRWNCPPEIIVVAT